MPFTLAHPALVLPLRRTGLPMTALVVGAMVPDVPRIVGQAEVKAWTHSAAGVVTVDLVLGLAVLALWHWFYRPPVVDLAPDPWRDRMPERSPTGAQAWALSVPALVVGAATHVVWDSFTHEDGWGVRRVGLLQDVYAGHPGYSWAQYGTSVVGLLAVGVAAVVALDRLPPGPPKPAPAVTRWAPGLVLVAAVTLGLGVALLVIPWGTKAVAFYGVLTWMLVTVTGGTGVCAWWHLKRRVPAVRGRDR